MSPFWMILIVPFYAFAAGFTGARIHNRKGYNRQLCEDGKGFPDCIVGALFWPVAIPITLLVMSVIAGMRAERIIMTRRERKAAALEAARRTDLRAVR